jgi:hypothetical protein
MVSSWMLPRVALVRTDFSEEHGASVIRVTRICELGTTLAVTSNRRTLRRNTKGSSETSVLTRATQHNIPEGTILHNVNVLRQNVTVDGGQSKVGACQLEVLLPYTNKKTKQTPWPLVRKRTIPTDRPPLVDEICTSAIYCKKYWVPETFFFAP